MCVTHGSRSLHHSPSRPESTPSSRQCLYCGQLIISVMMLFVTNLPGLKMNCSCCGFHLCRIATRAESQLITFSLKSRGPFVRSSAECVMEKGRGRLPLASWELHDTVTDELWEKKRGRALGGNPHPTGSFKKK